jgi:Flp pilus assembly protein TadD
VQSLDHPDLHFLNAAQGWLGLDCPEEAVVELNAIAPEFQLHPEVLEARWQLETRQQNWDAALRVAQLELQNTPDDSSGWLHHAYALRRASQGGLIMAWGALLPAAQKFPQEPVIAYNLACYACQLKEMDKAREWLDRAVKFGGREEIHKMALSDEDLKPLWPEIQKY